MGDNGAASVLSSTVLLATGVEDEDCGASDGKSESTAGSRASGASLFTCSVACTSK